MGAQSAPRTHIAARALTAIGRVEIARVDMPFEEEEWHFALGSSSTKRGLMIRLTDAEGRVGFGYSGEIRHDGESVEILDGASKVLAPALIGRDPREAAFSPDCWQDHLYGNRRAKSGIEFALWDLAGRQANSPTYQVLAGSSAEPLVSQVAVMRIVPLNTPERMAADAAALVEAGYAYLKLKASGELSLDVARVKRVREVVPDDVGLIVDANQSMTPKQAVRFGEQIADYAIDILEQPVHRHDLIGMKFVRDRVPQYVEADESVASTTQLAAYARADAIDAVAIKLASLGGLVPAIRLAEMCEAFGIRYRIGASFGSRLYGAANMQFLALKPPWYACEVGEFEHLTGDPCSSPNVDCGDLRLPNGVGLGAVIDHPEQLAWMTIAENG